MKIRPEHLSVMSKAMHDLLKKNPDKHLWYKANGLSIIRYRWDFLHASTFPCGSTGTAWICRELYPYLNDNHIDTALKHVIPRF